MRIAASYRLVRVLFEARPTFDFYLEMKSMNA